MKLMVLEQLVTSIGNSFIAFVPNLLAAIIVLLLGLVIGKLLGRVVKVVLIKARIDEWIADEEKLHFSLAKVLSVIVKWVIYLVFIQEAAYQLGVTAITAFVNNILSFIPGLIEAALVIIVGYSLAIYLKDRIVSSKTLYSDMVGKIIFFLLIYLSIALALPFVGIDPTLINNILLIIVGSIGIGIAIALGLGLKGIVAKTAESYALKFKGKKRR